jgi:basic membrane protein A
MDSAVYTTIENVVNDDFQGGGAPQVLGLEDDGVEAVYGDELGSEIPDDVKSALKESRQAIIDGDIEVPDSPE